MRSDLTWVDDKRTWRVRVQEDLTWVLSYYHAESDHWVQIGHFPTRQAAIDYSKEMS